MFDYQQISTEKRNKATTNIDSLSTINILKVINEEDQKVALAVKGALPQIEKVVDNLVNAFKNGGRMIYVGAGTSGRIGAMDASELLPTFSLDPAKAFCLMAGGKDAFYKAIEGAEDNAQQAVADLKNVALTKNDFVIGLSASGNATYVISAIEYANSIGCKTACIVTASNSRLAKVALLPIEAIIGEEVITGSTRLKSATAQKMICNMISTASMVKLGKVYENLMIDVTPTNQKLQARARNILMTITKCSLEDANDALSKYKTVKKSLFALLTKEEDVGAIDYYLNKEDGHIRNAINLYHKEKGNAND